MSLPLRQFGPKLPNHGSIGENCPACFEPFVAGDYTTLVELGPGVNEEERERAAAGRPYNAVAVEIHFACATGKPK